MLLKSISQLCFIILPLGLFSQINIQNQTFTDSRDNQTYSITQIGDTYWFKDNLRFVTPYSHCPNFNKKEEDCIDGNFYAYKELNSICPQGWTIPSVQNWEYYFNYLKEEKQVPTYNFTFDTLTEENNSIVIRDTSKTMKLMAEENLLNLSPLGWVQGRKRQNPGTITLWAKNEISPDPRYHLHIGNNGYVKHSHAHHIDDKIRKVRKFLVRCVCDVKVLEK